MLSRSDEPLSRSLSPDGRAPGRVTSGARLTPVPHWEGLPTGKTHIDVSDVAVDSHDRVYALARGPAEVFVYDRSGAFIISWGANVLSGRPHGIAVGPSDTVY